MTIPAKPNVRNEAEGHVHLVKDIGKVDEFIDSIVS